MIRQIGKYEITGEIGRGGFGCVYSAYDPTVKRVVAIKVLNAGSDASLVTRFRAEAMTAGNLHHQNIVVIHEFVEDQDLQYLVRMHSTLRIARRNVMARWPPPPRGCPHAAGRSAGA